MKQAHHARRAILVLECPWELDANDSNRTSVLPFVEGIAKLVGDVEVYHANFYDTRSLKQALKFLCVTRYENALIYIAGHGAGWKIAGVDLRDLMEEVGGHAQRTNISGVVLGSCFVGKHTATLESRLQETKLRWCVGYSSESDWLVGTMIDCSIMGRMIDLEDDDLADRDVMISALASAIEPFSESFIIGNDTRDQPVALGDSIQFVVQPRGQGQRARTVTAEVLSWKNAAALT